MKEEKIQLEYISNGKLYNNPPAIAKKQGGRYVITGFGLIP